MSAENRPNINAVGVVVEAIESIQKYSRGRAKLKGPITPEVQELIEKFANDVSDSLDRTYPPEISMSKWAPSGFEDC